MYHFVNLLLLGLITSLEKESLYVNNWASIYMKGFKLYHYKQQIMTRSKLAYFLGVFFTVIWNLHTVKVTAENNHELKWTHYAATWVNKHPYTVKLN